MQQCEPYVQSREITWYRTILNLLFVFGVSFNFFVCYCIIFLSPKMMSSYRWYLLWHQLITGFTDITYNFIAQPVLFCPFQMGYSQSIFREVLSAHNMCTLCITSSLISLASVQHLFLYRHLTIIGKNSSSSRNKLRAAFLYILALLSGLLYSFCFGDMAVIIEDESKYYSCITKDLLNITGFLVYDQWLVFRLVAPVVVLFGIEFFVETPYCIVSSLRNTSTSSMSRHLIRLQRKLFIQLCCQIFVPFVFVAGPLLMHNAIVYWKTFHFGMVFGHLVVLSLSSYSLVGGIVLVLMNPAYRGIVKRSRSTSAIAMTPKSLVQPAFK